MAGASAGSTTPGAGDGAAAGDAWGAMGASTSHEAAADLVSSGAHAQLTGTMMQDRVYELEDSLMKLTRDMVRLKMGVLPLLQNQMRSVEQRAVSKATDAAKKAANHQLEAEGKQAVRPAGG